ncbi:MAG: catalase, partial [Caldimonas sp.]
MATRNRKSPASASKSSRGATDAALESVGSILSTVSAPSTAALDPRAVSTLETEAQRRLASQKLGAQAMAAARPSNPLKAGEFGLDAGVAPEAGEALAPPNEIDGASTVTEDTVSDKLGDGVVQAGYNPANESLDRVRVDSGGRTLTTNQGVPIADNQNSLKAGLRGPTLLEDFILREKITHFDHER